MHTEFIHELLIHLPPEEESNTVEQKHHERQPMQTPNLKEPDGVAGRATERRVFGRQKSGVQIIQAEM